MQEANKLGIPVAGVVDSNNSRTASITSFRATMMPSAPCAFMCVPPPTLIWTGAPPLCGGRPMSSWRSERRGHRACEQRRSRLGLAG